MQLGHAIGDSLRHTVAHFFNRTAERLAKGIDIGRAVALDHDAAKPKEARAVIAPVIHAVTKSANYRQGDERREAAVEIALEFLAQDARHHLRDALGGLERDVADEAVAHHDVDASP